jgi:hypothetical protein
MIFDTFLLGTLDAFSALEIIGGRRLVVFVTLLGVSALEIIGGRCLGTELDASALEAATLDASALEAATLDSASSTACFGGMIGGRADIYYFLYFFVGDSSLYNQNKKWFIS